MQIWKPDDCLCNNVSSSSEHRNVCKWANSKKFFLLTFLMLFALFMQPYTASFSQTTKNESKPSTLVKISGVVTDEGDKPLIGVSVIEKGKGRGVHTDAEGKYSLSVTPGCILVFSYVGKESKEVTLDSKTTVDVSLTEAKKESTEVVVTGYFNKSKQTFAGAANTFAGDELRKISSQNMLTALSILDPSFKIIENNDIGSNPNQLPDYQIRGAASMGTSLEDTYKGNPNLPIFMLDGFQVSVERIYDLDPQRIASMTILKDAAALAIYGSRGANGVVVVTTIPPPIGKLQVTYNLAANFETADLSAYDLLDAREKISYESFAGVYTPKNATVYQKEAYDVLFNERLKLVQQGINTEWIKKPVKSLGVDLNHSLSVQGGDNTFRYGIDLSYNPTSGIMKGSERDRKGISVKLQYNFKGVKFSNQILYSGVKSTNSPYGKFSTYTYMNPYCSPYDENGDMVKQFVFRNISVANDLIVNPLYNTQLNTKDESKYDNFVDNFGIEWSISPAFRLTSKFSYSKTTQTTDVFKPSGHTDFIGKEKKGSYVKTTTESYDYEGQLGLTFNKQWNKHLLVANGNYSIQEISSDGYTVSASGFPNDRMDHIGMGIEYLGTKPTGIETISRSMGILGNFNYSYDNRFLADLSIRGDGSSQFGSNQRWGQFWSAALGWNLHKENFLKDVKAINLLKVRASYGLTGSQNFYPYQAMMMYKFLSDVTYVDYIGAVVNAYGNSDLKWQKTLKRNIGVDFEFFKSRLSGYVNLYFDNTQGALADISVAPSLGYNSYKANLGEVENRGYEISIKATLISNPVSKIYWSVYGMAAHNSNKLKKISNGLASYNSQKDQVTDTSSSKVSKTSVRFIEGESINTIWVVKSLGIDPATGEELFLSRSGNVTNKWNTADYVPYGCQDPKVTGTLGSSFSYKQFQISVYSQYRIGGEIYNSSLVDKVENVRAINNVDKRAFYDRWKQPGDIAAFKSVTNQNLTKPTSRFVEKYNWWQLSAVNLTYTLNSYSWIKKIGIDKAKISANMNDVCRFSTVKMERGIDYPYAKHFTLALQVMF